MPIANKFLASELLEVEEFLFGLHCKRSKVGNSLFCSFGFGLMQLMKNCFSKMLTIDNNDAGKL